MMREISFSEVTIGDNIVVAKILAEGAYRFDVLEVIDKTGKYIIADNQSHYYPNEDGNFIKISSY